MCSLCMCLIHATVHCCGFPVPDFNLTLSSQVTKEVLVRACIPRCGKAGLLKMSGFVVRRVFAVQLALSAVGACVNKESYKRCIHRLGLF